MDQPVAALMLLPIRDAFRGSAAAISATGASGGFGLRRRRRRQNMARGPRLAGCAAKKTDKIDSGNIDGEWQTAPLAALITGSPSHLASVIPQECLI
ncbi:MAG: hypothetical protein WA417_23190, partial [Stellaceae bacterium]